MEYTLLRVLPSCRSHRSHRGHVYLNLTTVSPCTCQNLSYPQPLRATDVGSTCIESGQSARPSHHDCLASTVWVFILPCLLRYLPPPCSLNLFLLFAFVSPLFDPPGEDLFLEETSSHPSLLYIELAPAPASASSHITRSDEPLFRSEPIGSLLSL